MALVPEIDSSKTDRHTVNIFTFLTTLLYDQ